MPFQNIAVAIQVNPTNVVCPPPAGGVITVTATVTGNVGGQRGKYQVYIYDADNWWFDTLLDQSLWVTSRPGPVNDVHTFTLTCDNNCHVRGLLGNIGEVITNIYAWVDGQRNITAMSAQVPLSCRVEEDDKRREQNVSS